MCHLPCPIEVIVIGNEMTDGTVIEETADEQTIVTPGENPPGKGNQQGQPVPEATV